MKRLFYIAIVLLSAGTMFGQTENPRGIYKMKTMICNQGFEINANC